jgi:hypothetical protein
MSVKERKKIMEPAAWPAAGERIAGYWVAGPKRVRR